MRHYFPELIWSSENCATLNADWMSRNLPNSLLLQTRNMFGNQSKIEPNPFPSSEAPINFCKCDGWHIFLARIFMATFLPPSYFSTQNSAHPTSFNLSRSILNNNFYFSFSSRLRERYSCFRLETQDWKIDILVLI